ncbi:hypothetical protein ACFCW7_23280 [Paenibacillus glucanolyticus]|uniref:hypothetical protein n=1 Tax=Paenibacillus glucanolyticus TaxID=59843 RepID=UPI0035DBB8AC
MYLVYDIFENIGRVTAIIFNPHESQLVENGMEVEEIPEPENYPGMVPFLHIDLESKELYYNYVKAPDPPSKEDTIEGKVEKLEIENGQIKDIVEEKDRENKNAIFEIYTMLGG